MRLLCTAIVLALVACKPSSSNTNDNTNGPGGASESTGGSGSVSGLVLDSNSGNGIAEATVVSGGATTKTDARGYFTLSGLAAGNVTLSVAKEGFAPGYATPKIGEVGQSTLVTLKKHGAKQNFDNGAATLSERTEAGPYAISFVGGSLETSDTQLQVSITPVDPSKEAMVLPGSLVTTSSTVLFPVTFAEFSILDSKGTKVQLKSGQSATVELPIPPSMRETYPLGAKIHCYAFNPTTGVWDDFVDGTVRASSVDGTTPVLAAAIKHFSWYGGAPEGDNCQDVYGQVVSAVDGKPLGNARVEATPGGATYTDADGNFTVIAGAGGAAKFFAYQTGLDVDGSLTGIAGAKYIEFGQVNEELAGLVRRPCNASGAPAANPPAGTKGGPDNRIKLQVGAIGKQAYEATAIIDGAAGSLTLSLSAGVPDEDGDLIDTQPASGAKISLSNGALVVAVPELAAGTGLYMLQAGGALSIEKGKTYTISIDTDGNGSIDGQGQVSVVGDLALTKPSAGGSYPAAGFTPTWTDSGTASAGYSAVYFLTLQGNGTISSYIGSDLSFLASDAFQGPGSTLAPGSYTAQLVAYSGFVQASGNNTLSQSNNITGLGVSGMAFSTAVAQTVTFTLE